MKIKFSKMHGLGNDFIMINAIENKLDDPASFADTMCKRRFGIGADQLILLEKSDLADYKMRIFNADGSEVEMCGNGIRCLAKFIGDEGISQAKKFKIETLAGDIYPEIIGDMVKVNMGIPKLLPSEIPVNIGGDSVINVPFKFGDKTYNITTVSMGNPHCVIFVDKPSKEDLLRYGRMIENDKVFPKRTNVEFVQVLSEEYIKVDVWERGSGLTMACGTGACASAVASTLNKKTGKIVNTELPGGNLIIEWTENGTVFMTGPAEKIYDGYIDL